jgi:hypothetical protein
VALVGQEYAKTMLSQLPMAYPKMQQQASTGSHGARPRTYPQDGGLAVVCVPQACAVQACAVQACAVQACAPGRLDAPRQRVNYMETALAGPSEPLLSGPRGPSSLLGPSGPPRPPRPTLSRSVASHARRGRRRAPRGSVSGRAALAARSGRWRRRVRADAVRQGPPSLSSLSSSELSSAAPRISFSLSVGMSQRSTPPCLSLSMYGRL